jgi:type II restriction/modification system DNA methylase subunit YeeA
MFDSGKKNGFKAITYMHRYTPDLLARVRTDYVHEQQERYRTKISNLEHESETAERARSVAIQKELKKLEAQLKECSDYEEKIHHLADQMIAIDLDDGVKVNYAKFQDVLAKIK